MKIDWKRKLSSRKWWLSVATAAVGVYMMITSGCTADTISGVVMAVGSVVAYTVSEGLVDASMKGE